MNVLYVYLAYTIEVREICHWKEHVFGTICAYCRASYEACELKLHVIICNLAKIGRASYEACELKRDQEQRHRGRQRVGPRMRPVN